MRPKVSDLLNKINRLALLPLSGIEIDLLKQHLRELYDELDTIKNQEQIVKNQDVIHETKTQELIAVLQQEIVVEKEEAIPIEKYQVKEKQRVAEKVGIATKSQPKSSINEIVQSSESLNSKLKTSSKEIHHKLSVKPLKELLDLNKRFVIVNELFKGNAEAFAKAIEQIDATNDFSSAEVLIRSQYQLDESSQTARLFFKLVKQKFGEE